MTAMKNDNPILPAVFFPRTRALIDKAASSLVPAPPRLDEAWIAEQHALLCSYGIAWWLLPPEPQTSLEVLDLVQKWRLPKPEEGT